MASLVGAVYFKLSGFLSSWLQDNIMSNIFLQPCNFEKIVRIIPQVTAMLPHQCKLTLSGPTIQKDQMPLSKLFSASTTNAIFWKSTVAPWFPAAREGLVSVVHLPPTKLMMTMHRTGLQSPLRLPPRRVHWRTLLRSSLHVCHKQGRGFKELMIELPLTHRWRYWSLDEETTPPSTFYKTLQQSCDIVTCIGPNQKYQPNEPCPFKTSPDIWLLDGSGDLVNLQFFPRT